MPLRSRASISLPFMSTWPGYFDLSLGEILLQGKYRHRVAARSVLCYFLVRELGMTATAVAERLGIGQPAVSIAVARGEAIVKERGLRLP